MYTIGLNMPVARQRPVILQDDDEKGWQDQIVTRLPFQSRTGGQIRADAKPYGSSNMCPNYSELRQPGLKQRPRHQHRYHVLATGTLSLLLLEVFPTLVTVKVPHLKRPNNTRPEPQW